jgi:FKBP-type peptidyl-prolyl cis-trans isomerase 2
MDRILVALCLGFVFNLSICDVKAEGGKMVIQDGRLVSFDYTLTVDGEVIETSKEQGPLQYTHGKGEIIPGLAKQLEGLGVGDEKTIEVPPEEAYGPVNPKAFREIPNTSLPADLEPRVGMYLQMQGPGGRILPVRVAEVKEDSVVLDLNHPLAGKTLIFQVKIVSIE